MKQIDADYDIILQDYDKKQYKSNQLQTERKKELYEKIPTLKEIDDEIVSISANIARLAVLGAEEEPSHLPSFIEKKKQLLSKKEALFLENGYPVNYLSNTYECNLCKDTGYVLGKKCHCFERALLSLQKQRDLTSVIPKEARFIAFRSDFYSDSPLPEEERTPRENALNALSFSENYVKNFKSQTENILFLGNTGTGKTFLSACIANALVEKGYSVYFVTAFRFFSVLEKYAFNRGSSDSTSPEETIDYMLRCDLLVLDDIGTEIINTFTLTKLYEFINERLTGGKATIITTNHTIFNIHKFYGERIFSRLIGNYNLIKLIGEDIRLLKGKSDLD